MINPSPRGEKQAHRCIESLLFKLFEHIKLVEDVDTAEVAKRIAKHQLKGFAAIAPRIAADLFHLEVLEDDIQTIKNNATRFVILRKRDHTKHNKQRFVSTNQDSFKSYNVS